MLIMNQDHDMVTVLDNLTEQSLCTVANFTEGTYWGLSLYLDKYFLGTFDNPGEATKEMQNIAEALYAGQQRYIVAGHCELTEDKEEMIDLLQDTLEEFD